MKPINRVYLLHRIPKEYYEVKKKWVACGTDPRGFIKFFNEGAQIEQKLSFVRTMEADKFPNLHILDIGTGCGFLPWILKHLGHTVQLADVMDGTPSIAYKECIESLGLIKHYSFAVLKNVPLPVEGMFNIISATGVAFHGGWTQQDWTFFINDCFSHLADNGLLFLHVNNTGDAKEGYQSLRSLSPLGGAWHDLHTLTIRKPA